MKRSSFIPTTDNLHVLRELGIEVEGCRVGGPAWRKRYETVDPNGLQAPQPPVRQEQ